MNEFFEVFSQNYQSDGYDEFIGYSGTPLDEEQMIKVANSYGITLPKYKIEKSILIQKIFPLDLPTGRFFSDIVFCKYSAGCFSE